MDGASSQASASDGGFASTPRSRHGACSSQTSAYGSAPSVEGKRRVTAVFQVQEDPPAPSGDRSRTLCFGCWFRVYLRLLLLEEDPWIQLIQLNAVNN